MMINNIGKDILLVVSAFFAPVIPLMTIVGILILIDTITGFIAARKVGEETTSRKLGAVISKQIIYMLLIISGHLMTILFLPSIPVAKVIAIYCGVIEFKSINENFKKYTGKNIWKFLIEKVDNYRNKSKDI